LARQTVDQDRQRGRIRRKIAGRDTRNIGLRLVGITYADQIGIGRGTLVANVDVVVAGRDIETRQVTEC
jgi:hypothetical protein